MSRYLKFLPGFKTSYIIIGTLYVFLSGSLFLRGLMPAMAEFQVPQPILESPHYYDAILWVYTHMMVLGLIIALVGWLCKDIVLQLWLSRLLFVVHIFYTYLDFRSSDSIIGNGLYKGSESLFPAIISLIVTMLFLNLSIYNKRSSQ